jgi:hypothetical protein
MKKTIFRAAIVAALMSTAAVTGAALLATPAAAAERVSKAAVPMIKAAQDALTAKDYATALQQIKAAQALPDLSDFDKFTINRFLAAVSANTKDFPTAATAYDAVTSSPYFTSELSADEQRATIHDALIISENAEHWPQVIAYGQKLEAIKALDELTETMMAIGYYKQKDNDNAKKYAQMAVDAAKAAGHDAQPNAIIILSNVAGKQDPDAARHMIETLILSTNSADDWSKLIDDALSHRGTKPIDAMFLFRLRVAVGAMRADDYTVVGPLAAQLHLDKEAATVWEQGISSGKITAGQANGLSAARSNAAKDASALSAIAAAASRSGKGQDSLAVAEDYWGYGRYGDVETMARAASSKGGLKDPSEATMLLGMALVMEGKYDEAQTTLATVNGNEVRARAAHLWALYAQVKAKGTPAAPAAH